MSIRTDRDGRSPRVVGLVAALALGVVGLFGGCLPDESSRPAGPEADVEAGGGGDGGDAGAETGAEDGDAESDGGGPRWELRFRAGSDYLQVREGESFQRLFVKGVNLGVAVPGTLAGQLAASREQYDRWLDEIREAGFNTIRIYTLHYPRFYEELRAHNRAHPDDPLYLLQGVWAPGDNPTGNLFDLREEFEANAREIVDAVHGDAEIDHRYGKAYGTFGADVSRWTLGYVIGREFTPREVMSTNSARPMATSFDGRYFEVESGDPVEIWLARRLETVVDYEKSRYGVERPVSVSSWPTLDPLDHPTEDSMYSAEDIAEFDMSVIEPAESRAGLFASYHAYPYYPNFMSEDPGYRMHADEKGPNAYLGYLIDLNAHHTDMPLLIAEFGVPSSWVNAHSGYKGMNHGGHTEREQGRAGGRMFGNLYEANTAGGALFAWIDEWWKPTWITNPRDFPSERRKLWHNVAAPEQNFGMIEFDPGEPTFGANSTIAGADLVPEAAVTTDVEYLHLRLQTRRPVESSDRIVVGIDTYGDALGESTLPGGVRVDNRCEYALVIEGRSSARLNVMEEYRMVGIWYEGGEGHRSYRSVASDDGEWRLVRFQNSQPHGTSDGEYWFEATYHDAGELGVWTPPEKKKSLDAVRIFEGRIDVRIPWTYLGVTDPSRRRVMHDDPSTKERETRRTEGVAISVAHDGTVLFESDRFGWSAWEEAPETQERVKRALPRLSDALDGLPDWMDAGED